MLFRHGLDDALRRHRRNDPCEFVIGGLEQSTKLRFGAFPSSVHHQHVQVEKLTKGRRSRVWHNHVNQQYSAILIHCSTAISEDCNGTMIVPIMDHATQKVSVCSLWNR